MTLKSINPATEKMLKEYAPHNDGTIEVMLEKAAAYASVRTSLPERAEKMIRAANILEGEAWQFAHIITMEMGKPLKEATAEVKKCALACRFYAENAEKFLKDKAVKTEASKAFVRYLPLGTILAVMPWNFPFWQVFRFAAPSLMAGNACLLKHASNVPQAALAIEDIFRRAGFEEGAFQSLLIGSEKVEQILNDNRIHAATLTGSEKAGASVAAIAGAQIKKTVLELGGSDPFIIMPSANLEDAINKAVTARTQNNGQSCIAAKRFIIHETLYETFRSKIIEKFEALKIGDPVNEDTDIGPLAMAKIRDDLEAQVKETVSQGAKILCGAERIHGKGFFYRPGLLENIPENSPAYKEEMFGPVGALFKVKNLDEAINLANTTRFGLGSSIFTHDKKEIQEAINRIKAGATFVNAIVASDPRLPFGGVKASGYGRELGIEGLQEFVNIKAVSIV